MYICCLNIVIQSKHLRLRTQNLFLISIENKKLLHNEMWPYKWSNALVAVLLFLIRNDSYLLDVNMIIDSLAWNKHLRYT